MQFKFHLVREARLSTDFSPEVKADERDDIMTGNSCCEAMVVVAKKFPDYTVKSWECVSKLKRDLDPSQFESPEECHKNQAQLLDIPEDKAMLLVEKNGWKLI